MASKDQLTANEVLCCRLAARGLSDHQVTVESGIDYVHVRIHLRDAFAKLGVHNRVELISLFPDEVVARTITPMQMLVFNTLTPKDREILSRLANGELNKQIGYNVDRTENAVKDRIKRIRIKLDVPLKQTRTALALLWREYLSYYEKDLSHERAVSVRADGASVVSAER